MSTYDSYEPRSNFGLFVFLAFVAAGIAAAALFFLQDVEESEVPVSSKPAEAPVEKAPAMPPGPIDPFETGPDDAAMKADTVALPSPEQTLVDLGLGVAELEPEILLRKIGESLEEGKFEEAAVMIGKDALSLEHLKDLQKLIAADSFRLHSESPVTEIGELEANRRSRWALNFDGEGGSTIYFDLLRGDTGKWAIEKIKIPEPVAPAEVPPPTVFVDSLGVTSSFLKAVLEQNFDDAKSFVDTKLVSDAKIAGLCIIFEEAKYQLRPKKPLRAMFNRDRTAGFIAHVQDKGGEKAADFGISVSRESPDHPWQVSEINLDSLLADYADRVAGGDVHYTPLVKNPAGGDTLILYFGFDEDGLTPRTQKQLGIVAGLLKVDSGKKLTLSGHTDSLGTDDYNGNLSARRARAVENYLLEVGVPRSQIVALAEGESKPRLPNQTASGEDNPSGRRANRRTEIYLDF